MTNFNLILSTQHSFEQIAETEIWFQLLALGDDNPTILHSSISGILLVDTSLNPYDVIEKMHDILVKDPKFFQYILKLIPIDCVMETDLSIMQQRVKEILLDKQELTKSGKFSVEIRKRATNLSKSEIISAITEDINKDVDLKNPDWMIWVEIIGNITGISILTKKDILQAQKSKGNY